MMLTRHEEMMIRVANMLVSKGWDEGVAINAVNRYQDRIHWQDTVSRNGAAVVKAWTDAMETSARTGVRHTGGGNGVITGFDLFDVDESPVKPTQIREIAKRFAEPTRMSAERVLKPEGVAMLPRPTILFFEKFSPHNRSLVTARVWVVESEARNEREASRLGVRLKKSLIAKRSVHYSDPKLHDLTLFVIYNDGQSMIEVPGTQPL